jgi:phage terminase small subunit
MPSGGYRPGAGRKKGVKNKRPAAAKKPSGKAVNPKNAAQIKKMLEVGELVKAKLYHALVSKVAAGESLTSAELAKVAQLEKELRSIVEPPVEIPKKDPLTYMIDVINDDMADAEIRARMAIAAAPYLHAKPGETHKGKKDEKNDKAKAAGSGRFAPSAPPQLKAVK